jgi:hypothetical protein
MRADSRRQSTELAKSGALASVQVQPPLTSQASLPSVTAATPFGPDDFAAFLLKQGLTHQPTGSSVYDACLGQVAVMLDFFSRVENGLLRPGDEEYQRIALFHLEKSAKLIAVLEPKMHDACKAIEDLSPSNPSMLSPEKRKQAIDFKNRALSRFEAIKRELNEALQHPDRIRLTRGKAAYFFLVNAMLTDAASAMMAWTGKLNQQQLNFSPSMLGSLDSDEGKRVRQFLDDAFAHTPSFVADMLSENEQRLLQDKLTPFSYLDKRWIASAVVPVFSQSGAFGLAAGVLAACNNSFLMTAPTHKLHSAHLGAYKHLMDAIQHDCGHMAAMCASGVIQAPASGRSIAATAFLDIVLRLLSSSSTTSTADTKTDLVLMFYLLQDNSGVFLPSHRSKSFLQSAEAFYVSLHLAGDIIRPLRDLGFPIASTTAEGALDNTACLRDVAKAMAEIWTGFRSRHIDLLKRHGIDKRFPTWFEKT